MININDIKEKLKKEGYITNLEIETALLPVLNSNQPLLIEGDPGVGKTTLAKAVANAFGYDFIRVQFYEGLTADKILYDYNYQKQLLTIESLKSVIEKNVENLSIDKAIHETSKINFYGEDFLIERPVLKSIRSKNRCVLLLDEIDKSSEDIEYALLEFLDEFSLTIPELGTITCENELKPIVFLTSNSYRELSDALKRRCNYLYLNKKTISEVEDIIKSKIEADDKLITSCVNILGRISELNLKQPISIGESIAWIKFISENDPDSIDNTISMLAKNKEDIKKINKILKR